MSREESVIDVNSAMFHTSRTEIIDALMQVVKANPHISSADLYGAGMLVMGQLAAVIGVDPKGETTYKLFRLGYDAAIEAGKQKPTHTAH